MKRLTWSYNEAKPGIHCTRTDRMFYLSIPLGRWGGRYKRFRFVRVNGKIVCGRIGDDGGRDSSAATDITGPFGRLA